MELSEIAQKIAQKVLSRPISDEDLDAVKRAGIDGTKINDECIKHSALYAYWALLYRVSMKTTREAIRDYKCFLEDEDNRIRIKAAAEGKKITESSIDKECKRHPEYRKLYDKYLEVLFQSDMFEGYVKSLEQRKDMLYSAAATYRKERDMDVVVREKGIEDHFK